MKKLQPLDLLAIGLFVLILSPELFQQGMFVDGVTYGAISRNLAEGIGTLDIPSYATLYNEFHEHPPFFFWIQGLFFWVFGDHFFIERIANLVLGLGAIWALFLLQSTIISEEALKKHRYLSLLILITFPLVSWAYSNNMLENLMVLLSLLGAICYLRAYLKKEWWMYSLGSLLLLCSFLTKGVVGIFPLAVIGIHFIVFRTESFKKTLASTFIALGSLVLISFAVSLLYKDLTLSVQAYIDQQLLPALKGEREITTGYRAKILVDLLGQIAIPSFIAILLLIRAKVKKLNQPTNWKLFTFFILIGISASAPLMVSLKQRPFYLIPSLPYYALAIFTVIAPQLSFDPNAFKIKRIATYSAIIIWLFAVSVSIYNYGSYSRDQQKIEDVVLLSKELPTNTVIGGPADIWEDWGLQSYLARKGHIGLACKLDGDYIILLKDDKRSEEIPDNYRPLDLKLSKYQVWKKD